MGILKRICLQSLVICFLSFYPVSNIYAEKKTDKVFEFYNSLLLSYIDTYNNEFVEGDLKIVFSYCSRGIHDKNVINYYYVLEEEYSSILYVWNLVIVKNEGGLYDLVVQIDIRGVKKG